MTEEEPTTCEYCEETFYGERPYFKHLKNNHYEELGSIDKRRVDEQTTPTTTALTILKENIAVVVLGVLFIVAGLTMYYSIMGSTSSEPTVSEGIQTPGASGTVHEHAQMDVVVDGDSINFALPEYQFKSEKVHFESGNGEKLHLHAEGVTIAYTLETLGFTVTDNGDTIEFDGTTYSAADGDTVTYEVDGESVDPYTYELQPNEQIEITITKEE